MYTHTHKRLTLVCSINDNILFYAQTGTEKRFEKYCHFVVVVKPCTHHRRDIILVVAEKMISFAVAQIIFFVTASNSI